MLTPEFFARPTLEVAPDLLGATLLVATAEGRCSGRITEVEAYLGAEDPASHAAGGPTPRCAVMFGAPGRTYVYFIYGMHHCLNFVTEPEGTPGAVLIRAVEPLTGLDLMTRRRGGIRKRDLANGPGKLCQALGIDRGWNDLPLTVGEGRRIWLEGSGQPVPFSRGPRVGIKKGQELLFRFWMDQT